MHHPLPYQSLDPNPRVPARAWIFLLIAWIMFLAPWYLLGLGQGATKNMRFWTETIQHHGAFSWTTSVRIALLVPTLIQAIIVFTTALLARNSVRHGKTTSVRVIRIAATGAILVGITPLLVLAYTLFFIIR